MREKSHRMKTKEECFGKMTKIVVLYQPLNPDHCFVAALGLSGEQDAKEKEMEENMEEVIKIPLKY